jgi:hypothetical protein
VNHAIEELVSIIAKAPVDLGRRAKWLDRLWDAYVADAIPYVETLGECLGELCSTRELCLDLGRQSDRASAGDLARSPDRFVLPGTPVCLSSLLAAGRYQELLNLIEMAPFVCWDNRHWGVQAWAAMGKRAEAIRYAEASRGLNDLTRSSRVRADPALVGPGRRSL